MRYFILSSVVILFFFGSIAGFASQSILGPSTGCEKLNLEDNAGCIIIKIEFTLDGEFWSCKPLQVLPKSRKKELVKAACNWAKKGNWPEVQPGMLSTRYMLTFEFD